MDNSGEIYTQTLFSEFNNTKSDSISEWGTFKDSLRTPIHNWFTYTAGFSYKAVKASISEYYLSDSDFIYDPFMGSGTTNLTAKSTGINSFGVEAHPFVFRIAKTKLNWEIKRTDIFDAIEYIERYTNDQRKQIASDIKCILVNEFPELILKCFEEKTLFDLFLIREAIKKGDLLPDLSDFLFVGLNGLLRKISTAATGWPYIDPNKQKTSSLNKDALVEFSRLLNFMANDLIYVRNNAHSNYLNTKHNISLGDSRHTTETIPDNCMDLVFTSPPYLNNFDYADRTRLELYFFGEAKTWGDITQNIRTKLITSATTQISRDDPRYILSDSIKDACPSVYNLLNKATSDLRSIRLTRGGKKSYDHLVSGYFNDMFQVISDVYRVLKPHKRAIFVLGDSAPYGVHIQTDVLLGEIGLGVGFSDYDIKVLRERGGKWKDNPQRHNVLLRESIVTLKKD
jgi:DNA modification methylase